MDAVGRQCEPEKADGRDAEANKDEQRALAHAVAREAQTERDDEGEDGADAVEAVCAVAAEAQALDDRRRIRIDGRKHDRGEKGHEAVAPHLPADEDVKVDAAHPAAALRRLGWVVACHALVDRFCLHFGQDGQPAAKERVPRGAGEARR